MRSRAAAADDAESIRRLCGQLDYAIDPDTVVLRLTRILSSPSDRLWVSVAEADRVLGFLHAFERLALETPPQVTVQALVVERAARRRGVGRVLMAAAEAWARELGLAVVGLHTRTRRQDARGFYEAIGYEVFSESLAYKKRVGR